MKKTRISQLLGIDLPLIQGGMSLLAGAELAAAVSNAGGLGIISPDAGMAAHSDKVQNLRHLLARTRELTSKPFGINLPLRTSDINELIEVTLQEKVSVVITSMGDPASYTYLLKDNGVTVLHVVASVKQAVRAEVFGVDAVIAEGCEAGGHIGHDELTTFVLVPQIADAVKIPIVAAGGIADARGLVAAIALGAEGVQIGTRFITSPECIAHARVKEAILKASDTDTVITCRKLGPHRVLKNELAARLIEMESAGYSANEIANVLASINRPRQGEIEGNLADGEVYCGAIAGMIPNIIKAGDIVESIAYSSREVIARLNNIWS